MTCLATSRCVPPSLWSPYPLLVSVLTWDENAENPRTPARRPPRVREPPRPLPQRAQGQVTQGDRGSPLACEVGSYTPRTNGKPERSANWACYRALEFTCLALQANVDKESEELADSFRGAYGQTLKPHHSFLVKPVFSAAMSACPYRKDFYGKLGADQAKVNAELKEYLAALGKIVGILKEFLASKEAKW